MGGDRRGEGLVGLILEGCMRDRPGVESRDGEFGVVSREDRDAYAVKRSSSSVSL